MKKAYFARDRYDTEGVGVIVFGETPTEAKKNAYGHESTEDYIDIRVTRNNAFDKFANDDIVWLEIGYSVESDRIFRAELWSFPESKKCSRCWLAEFYSVPESTVGDDGLCEECRREQG